MYYQLAAVTSFSCQNLSIQQNLFLHHSYLGQFSESTVLYRTKKSTTLNILKNSPSFGFLQSSWSRELKVLPQERYATKDQPLGGGGRGEAI